MARYALREIVLIVLAGGGAIAVTAWFTGYWAILPAIPTAFLLWFFRDPPRSVPSDVRTLVAPADGRIVEISRNVLDENGRPTLRIMIFLSVFNVHVNRAPCSGCISDVQYRRGKFLNALSSRADAVNESNALWIDPDPPLPGLVKVRQIAGVLARRIVCTVRVRDIVARGERFGMIKLGSRTEMCVPEDPRWRPMVQVGEAVRGGRTILLRLSENRNE